MSNPIETKYRGAFRTAWGSTWRSMIQHEGRRYDLGTFPNAEEAARAYDRAASQLGKKFRNFPEEPRTDTES